MKISFAFCLVVLLASGVQPSSARGEYQAALDLYAKKQYPQAAQYFEAASLSDPNNVAANYYAGYSFYLAGRRAEAIASFWRLAKAYPARKEGLQAREFLKKIDPDYAKNDSGVPATAAGATAGVSGSSTAGTTVVATPKPSARGLVNGLVQVKPSAGKNANVSSAFVEKIKGLLVTMPLSVLLFLRDEGASVMIVSSVVEHDMRLQNTVPRGWNEDFSWKESPALTYGKKVVVSQYKNDRKTGEAVDTSKEIGVVRHETGHALDHCLDDFTKTSEFRHAHYLDAAKVPDEYRSRLDYFLQLASGGPSETFAELFCYSQGGETDAHRQESCELVHKYFPLCEAEMRKQLAKLESKYGK